jgi:hypothetical protein
MPSKRAISTDFRKTIVSDTDDAREAELEAAASSLKQGLKSCRSVISSYRNLLAGDQDNNAPLSEENDSEQRQVSAS